MHKTFQGVNVNVQQLALSLAQWFRSKGYISQYYGYGNNYVVQAKKEGFLRHFIAANRAFTVKITGYSGYLDVDIGVANWIKAEDATEALIGGLILGPLGLLIEGGEGLWNLEIEHETMNEIERLIKSGLVSMNIQQYYAPQQYYVPPQQSKVCPNCGFQNLPHARFCSNCGTQLL